MMITTQSGEDDGIIFAFAQGKGVKENQEDAFGHFVGECFCIADGLSTSKAAQKASTYAIDRSIFAYKVLRQKHFYWRAKERLVRQLFRATGRGVFVKNAKESIDMKTTLAVACFSPGWWWVGNVGDSRVYRLRAGRFEQITTDHTNDKGQLTRWIGMKKFVAPDQFGGELKSGDIFLLTTDGLIKGFSDVTIHEHLSQLENTKEALEKGVKELVQKSLDADDSDNITVCVIKKL